MVTGSTISRQDGIICPQGVQSHDKHCTICPPPYHLTMNDVSNVHKQYNLTARLYQVSTRRPISPQDCTKCLQVVPSHGKMGLLSVHW